MKQNAFKKETGWIELICGPMFAGKSEELLRKLKRLEYAEVPYVVFKPKIDSRHTKAIVSRDGRKMHSLEFTNPTEILDYLLTTNKIPKVVAIDEAQFIDESIVQICDTLADLGFIVYVSALDRNFKNEPFLVTAKLACYAEVIQKLPAICTECGADGTITQRMADEKAGRYDEPTIQIGDQDLYTVRCRTHHKILNKPIDQNLHKFKSDFKKRLKSLPAKPAE